MVPSLKQLPWELEEEILSCLPFKALVRFRSVCKQWNSLFNDKSFLKNHSSRSPRQFILVTADQKVYSIDIIGPNSIDPTIDLCLLPSSEIPYRDGTLDFSAITACDDFLFCINNSYWEKKKIALWNPWLRQVTWIEHMDKKLKVVGLGYDNSRPDKVYKMLVSYWGYPERNAVYECASHAFKSIDKHDHDCRPLSSVSLRRSYVPLNGNLYWVDYNRKTCEYFIQSFDFSTESFKPLCLLPCQQCHGWDSDLLLAVYEGERFSLLKQCHETRNIEVWVTKKRISYNNIGDDGDGVVVWINFMTFPATNLPTLFHYIDDCNGISYFIYNKTIFICCGDGETEVACIYVVKKDLCKKIQIGSGIVIFCHCVYTPNLISIPSFT